MDANTTYVNEKKIERTIVALKRNRMNGYFIKNKEELLQKIQELVPENSLVTVGGSMSLFETGVIPFLKSGNYDYLDRYADGLTPDEIQGIYRKAFSADAYFTSTNALTEDGILYNVDGNGNRVAAMIYGPSKVIVICGANKIVRDLPAAIKRNEEISAPANTKRLNTQTPCVATGICMHCNSPAKICRAYTAISSQKDDTRIHVLILDESIGY